MNWGQVAIGVYCAIENEGLAHDRACQQFHALRLAETGLKGDSMRKLAAQRANLDAAKKT